MIAVTVVVVSTTTVTIAAIHTTIHGITTAPTRATIIVRRIGILTARRSLCGGGTE